MSTATSGGNIAINALEIPGNAHLGVVATNTIATTQSATGFGVNAAATSSTSIVAVKLRNSNYPNAGAGSNATLDADATNQTTTPPVFAGPSGDPFAFDFHQGASSPTVASGAIYVPTSNGYAAVSGTDFEGDPRVHQTADSSYMTVDIGADQHADPTPTQRYAAVGGSTNTAICPASAPCDLLTAFGGAEAGDEVVVAPGRYDLGTNRLYDGGNVPLSIHGEVGKSRPVIVSNFDAAMLYLATDGSAVRDLELDNAAGAALHLTGDGSVAEQIVARGGGGDGCDLYGRALIRDSICASMAAAADEDDGLFIRADGPGDVMVRNVTAVSRYEGLYIYDSYGPVGQSIKIANVVARGGPAGADLYAFGLGSIPVSISHSNFETVGSGTVFTDDGTNQIAAPLFVNPTGARDAAGHEAYDYHEAAGSPTIGAGVVDPATDPTATDVDGETRLSDGKIDIGGDQFHAPPVTPPTPTTTTTTPTTPPDRTAPALARLLLKPASFAVLGKGQRPKKGVSYKTNVSFSLSEPAVVRATVQVKAMGRTVGKSCQAPSSKNREGRPCQLTGHLVGGTCQKPSAKNKNARSCKLWTNVGLAFSKSAKKGTTTVAFVGKVGKKALKPGSYRLALTATDPARNVSSLKALSFAVKAG